MTSPGYPNFYDPSDPRQPPVKPGDELAGKYRIDRVVGAGAMGVVVQAWHIELEQPVAIKFLYPEFARHHDGAERFRREARAAAKIKNQHVARVVDVGTLDAANIPYIVMEYLEGRDLARELVQRGRLPVALAVQYVLQACEAVAEAHEHGIVHRDLKPANLFLSEGPGGSSMIKVLDFGISKVNGAAPQQFSLTDTATLMGSPAYMSPEQLESSRNVDARADIWSLGIILHELLLGQVPFNGDSVPQLVRAILSGTRSTLLERDARLVELEVVVARCLRQDREQRFQSIAELREALRPFAAFRVDETAAGLAPSVDPITAPAADAAAEQSSAAAGLPLSGTHPSPRIAAEAEGRSPDAGAAEAREPGGAAGAVPSAWGNTQRGRTRRWQRGVPVALLLAIVGAGSYWATSLLSVSVSPPPSAPPSSPYSGPPPHSSEDKPLQPEGTAFGTRPNAAQNPEPGAPQAASMAAPVHASTPAPAAASAPSPAAAVSTLSHAPGTAAATAPALAPFAQPTAAGHAANAPAPSPAVPSGSHGTEVEKSDKPKPAPSHRGGYEVPDFGGRE